MMANTDPSDPKSPAYAGPCPRCGGPVPNESFMGEYPGALSRYDNETYICSACGTAEAMYQYYERANRFTKSTLPPVNQPIPSEVAK